MDIPEKVNILYKTYTISECQGLHDGNQDLCGQIQYLSQQILLNSEMSEELKKATLLHELVHGLDEMYNIGLKEKQVDKLGNALYMLIRDNPEMFKGQQAGGVPDDRDTEGT